VAAHAIENSVSATGPRRVGRPLQAMVGLPFPEFIAEILE
jgi:hypothetical protein